MPKIKNIIVFIIAILLIGVFLPIFLPNLTNYDGSYTRTNVINQYTTHNDTLIYDSGDSDTISSSDTYWSFPAAQLYVGFISSGDSNLTFVSAIGKANTALSRTFKYEIYSSQNANNRTEPNALVYTLNQTFTTTDTNVHFVNVTGLLLPLDSDDTFNNTWFLSIVSTNGGIWKWGYNTLTNTTNYKVVDATYYLSDVDFCMNVSIQYSSSQLITQTTTYYNTNVATMVSSILPITIVVSIIVAIISKKSQKD